MLINYDLEMWCSVPPSVSAAVTVILIHFKGLASLTKDH